MQIWQENNNCETRSSIKWSMRTSQRHGITNEERHWGQN